MARCGTYGDEPDDGCADCSLINFDDKNGVCPGENAGFRQCSNPVFSVKCSKLNLEENQIVVLDNLNQIKCLIDDLVDDTEGIGVRVEISVLAPESCKKNPFTLKAPASNSVLTLDTGCGTLDLNLELSTSIPVGLAPTVSGSGTHLILNYIVAVNPIIKAFAANRCDDSFQLIFGELQIGSVAPCSHPKDAYVRADIHVFTWREVPDSDPRRREIVKCYPIERCYEKSNQ